MPQMFQVKESRIVSQIVNWLEQQSHTWCFKVHGGAYQTKGVPDIVGCHKGQFFALEVKRPGGKTSKLQDWQMEQIIKAQGKTQVVTSLTEVKEFINGFSE